MRPIGKASSEGPAGPPGPVQVRRGPSRSQGPLAAPGVLIGRVRPGKRDVSTPIGQGLEASTIAQPLALDRRIESEEFLLPTQSLLLSIGAVEGIVIGKPLLGIGFLNLPGRIAEEAIESGIGTGEHVRKLQFPMEKPELRAQSGNDGPRPDRGLGVQTAILKGDKLSPSGYVKYDVCSNEHVIRFPGCGTSIAVLNCSSRRSRTAALTGKVRIGGCVADIAEELAPMPPKVDQGAFGF